MSDSLLRYFSPKALRLAWERMIRSNGKDVKDFFGMEVYGSNLEKNLQRLSEAIVYGEYQPQRPFKYYEPKASRTHRTKTVLNVEDALVYQAIADQVACANYSRLARHNSFVYGSVLHPEVELGLELLEKEDASFFFFEYYVPLYNKFLNSVNYQIENNAIHFRLETDITGFFDCIPHSRLLISLHQFGVDPVILDLLAKCLNTWSGTRDSLTPGVGIPQGPAASFFLANLFLSDLDELIQENGYTYYRYMDDIRIYEEEEEKLVEALVLIDNFLKSRALSLNTKKTSIEEIKLREPEKILRFIDYEDDLDHFVQYFNTEISEIKEEGSASDFSEQHPDNEQGNGIAYQFLKEAELIAYCKKEVAETEKELFEYFKDLDNPDFEHRSLSTNETLKKEIVHLAYRWRNANSILSQRNAAVLNEKLIPIWLFCVEHFFWKANHFCWNLNLYPSNNEIVKKLDTLQNKLKLYEWVRYQILSNLAFAQNFNSKQLKDLFRRAKEEPSPLVRMGVYTIVLKHLDPKDQLFQSVLTAVERDNNPYLKKALAYLLRRLELDTNLKEFKFWFGL